MYKHECVQCSKKHGHKCPLFVSFYNRFFGTIQVTNCIKYLEAVKKGGK